MGLPIFISTLIQIYDIWLKILDQCKMPWYHTLGGEKMKNEMETSIQRLQDNLPAIRKIAGWRAVDLGDLIGVTKQSISNLETRKSKITLMQYIAIRHMIDYQIETHPENKALKQIVPLLLDNTSQNTQEYDRIVKAAEELSNAAAGGVSDNVLATIIESLLPGENEKNPPLNWTEQIWAGISSEQQ